MSLYDQISNDMKSAMKSGETLKRDTLRMLLSQFKYARIDKNGDLTPDEEISVIMNGAKKRKEAIDLYQKSGRSDLQEKEQNELEIISSYLPKQLSDEEIAEIVASAIQDVGAQTMKDMGKVMSAAMKELKGRADGKKVQEIVRQKLG